MSVATAHTTRLALPSVGIVLLNWNGYVDTQRCLESLVPVTYPKHTTYLADNGSTDGSMDRLEAEWADRGIVFIRNGANVGFSAGCNPAIRRALADGCRYVLLLNNDCIVGEPAFLESMVELAEANPRVGMVGGKLMCWPNTGVIWGTGGWIHWISETYVGAGEPDHGQHDRVAERGFICGGLMLVRKEVLEHVGLLPEEYFLGREDWEYGVRVHRHGYRMLYQPKAVVYHAGERSYAPASRRYLLNNVLSKILFKKRNLPPASFRLWLTTYSLYVKVLMPLLARLMPRRYSVEASSWRQAALVAIAEAPRLERTTLEMLERLATESQARLRGIG